MNETNKKSLKLTGTAALAAALLISGSLAWRDVSQHKTNKFETKSVSQSMVLVENFKDKLDWIPGENVAKEIFVRNGQNTDDIQNYIYSDGYVRLQMREFLGKATPEIKYSNFRYLIDTNGDHVKGTKKELAEVEAKKIWPDQKSYVIEQVETPMDEGNGAPDGGYWYVRTNENAPNGVYGKFIMIKNEAGDLVSVFDGAKVTKGDLDKDQANASEGTSAKKPGHNNDNALAGNVEDESDFYRTHSWKTTNQVADYIELTLGKEVKKLSEWKVKPEPGKFWILDDESDSGWVYWGERLNHNKVGSISNNSITHNFLESVTLKDTAEQLVYRLHVNMDAVSFSDMEKTDGTGWGEAGKDFPTAIKEAYFGQESLTVNKTNLKNIIDSVEGLDETKYTHDTWSALQVALSSAKQVYEKTDATQKEVNAQYNFLNEAFQSLVLVNYEIGSQFTMANINWTVVANNNEKSLILADSLTPAQLKEIGIKMADESIGSVKYHVTGKNYGLGYSKSYLKEVDEAFYENLIVGTELENKVQSVEWNEEKGVDSWNTRTDGATTLSPNGSKTAFSLSVSDINVYNIPFDVFSGEEKVWLRSPGETATTAATLRYVDDFNLGFASNLVYNVGINVRPALWVDMH